jgi:ATP-dependent helicase/nuclease subunit A
MPNSPVDPMQDEKIREIVTFPGDALVVANAGAGKTTLLVERYFELLSQGLEPESILAFTFTEKAAGEMKSRILERFSTHPHFFDFPEEILQDFKARAWNSPIGTIHQFCLQLILEAHAGDSSGRLKIIEEATEAQLQERIARRHLRERLQREEPDALLLLTTFGIQNLKRLLREYLEAGKNPYGEEIALPPCEAAEAQLLSALETLAAPIREELTEEKRKLGWIHFDDMEREALKLLRDPPPGLRRGLPRYRHALIDEFQDTSPIQIEIVETLRATLAAMGRPLLLFCVGDPKQSIYRFRKVDRNLIAKSEQALVARGGRRFESVQNFRSAPALLRFVNAFAQSAFPQAALSLPARPETADSRVRLVFLPTEAETDSAEDYRIREAQWVAGEIERRRKSGAEWEHFAILARYSASFLPLLKELKARGIPFAIRGGQELLDRQEILDLVRLLRFLKNPNDNLSLVGVLRSPLFLISDLTLLFLRDGAPEGPLWEYLRTDASLQGLRDRSAPDLAKLTWTIEVLSRLLETAPGLAPSRLLRGFLDCYEIAPLVSLAEYDTDASLGIEQFLEWLAQIEDENRTASLAELLEIVENLRKLEVHKTPLGNLIEVQNCVHLLTFHAAKGLEYDTVFVIDLERPAPIETSRLQHLERQYALKLPSGDAETWTPSPRFQALAAYHREEEKEENKRLLYVALTRAKREILLTFQPKPRKKDNLQNLLLESLGERAGEWIETAEPFAEAPPSSRPPVPGTPDFLEVPLPAFPPVPGGIEATVSELETFQVCPLKHHYLSVCRVPDSSWEDPWDLNPTERGTLLHAALRWLTVHPEGSPREALQAAAADRTVGPSEAVLDEMSGVLSDYLLSPGWKSIAAAQEDFSELPFLLQIEGGKVRGQIDRLIRKKDGAWRLIDFKYMTRRDSEAEIRQAYGFQLKTYALAAGKFLRSVPEGVEIHLLGSKVIEFRFSPGELAEHQRVLEATLLRMRKPLLAAVETNPGCFSCPFHEKIPLCGVPRGRPWTPERGMFFS